jgi:glucose-fructose oxidoreductase
MEANQKIRYAVVGIGSIAQEAVLPAFVHAEKSELTALVSGDDEKREELGKKYGCKTYSYEQYEECLGSGTVDAVYIAVPNHLHRRYAEGAARKGVHILCEKPLAHNEEDCQAIIEAAQKGGVKLMAAYRLHFEEANLEAIRICESGEIGEVRIFNSVFGQQVADGNVRLTETSEQGGGPLFDMGVYCINAARYLFRDEPVEVAAFTANNGEKRFEKTDEMLSVMLRFPKERLANFTVSFGTSRVGEYTVAGSKGTLSLSPSYGYTADIHLKLVKDGKTTEKVYPKRDQFAPELIYFSRCILENEEPEPSGEEGLIDVQIVRAAYRACTAGRALPIETAHRTRRPEPSQEIHKPPVETQELVNARMPSGSKKK